ncbi:glycosyltransferase family 4 protein [Muriicola soli]|uniref:Glycosyltransferase n=1 Tax=Muriicola soli TaxID=2507538 RepID=A0A411ECC9_9FLAO|nr:glycosyltransferase family 4 protein [Muriicola soli]QBA65405.1 glycosyltransferase [Muriicola soli]
MSNRKDILVFAKRYNVKNPEQIGGAIRLSEELIDDLQTLKESFTVIDINPANGGGFFLTYIKVIWKTIIQTKKHNSVLFIGSDRVVVHLAPVVLLIGKLCNRKVTLKKVGGGFDRFYNESGYLVKLRIRWLMKNVVATLFETKQLVNYFKSFGRTVWFPNVRNFPERKIIPGAYQKRFAFISQVKNTKGVIEILEACQILGSDYRIHIYGPIVDLVIPDHLKSIFDEIYKGALKPDEVLKTIENYDVIMLPTYYPGEGYPGILIESYSMGKPVISTIWNSIPEIIDHEKTGLLIAPKDKTALVEAIEWYNVKNYPILSENALNYSKQFNSLYQTSDKLNLIKGNA